MSGGVKAVSRGLLFDGLRVGITGAVPERQHWGEVHDLDRLILSFVSQLSGFILDYGGQVVHGTHPLFTPIVAQEASRQPDGASETLTLVASMLWGRHPVLIERARRVAKPQVLLTPKIGAGGPEDPETRNRCLTALRMTLADEIDVLIAVGGKLHQDAGVNRGVLEELVQARWKQVPCFIVAGLGGAASDLGRDVVRVLSEGNGLADSPDLATWNEHMDEHVSRLLIHLADHRDEFSNRRPTTRPRFIAAGPEVNASERYDPPRQLDLVRADPPFKNSMGPRPAPKPPARRREEIVQVDQHELRECSERFDQLRDALAHGHLQDFTRQLRPGARG